jgi:hypothetical protein
MYEWAEEGTKKGQVNELHYWLNSFKLVDVRDVDTKRKIFWRTWISTTDKSRC